MLKWVVNVFNSTRITFAYFGYEKVCREKWVAEVDLIYSTDKVLQDIAALMAAPLHHVAKNFDAPSELLDRRREAVLQSLLDAESKLGILARDYKKELDTGYVELNALREQIGICQVHLSNAYDDLKSAKQDLDSWYSRAEGNWLGNGGKRLPAHAFFGQDLSDRDRFKSRRDSAAQAINIYKTERNQLSQRFEKARQTVQRIKDERQKMFDLKKAGFDKRIVNAVIEKGNSEIRSIDDKVAQLRGSRNIYLKQQKDTLGVNKLEAEVDRLKFAHRSKIKEFDRPSALEERKAKHREEWLAAQEQ